MTDESKFEAISALVDGESAAAEAGVLDQLLHDDAVRARWTRYHLISDCIRGQLPRRIDPAFDRRVAAALRDEPTVLAPASAQVSRWVRPLAGLAVAASVAALAIFAIRPDHEVAVSPAVPQVASADAGHAPAQGQFRFAAGNAAGGPARVQTTPGRMNARLNRYLVNYNEYRNNAAVQGMIPYVRIVAHDEDN